jgi:uncharacterized protein YlxW (UPF0749 family)
MQSGNKNKSDMNSLKTDLAAASVELLSAHCATDRIRLRYSQQDIVAFGDPTVLQKAISSAGAVYRFFSLVEAQIRHKEQSQR